MLDCIIAIYQHYPYNNYELLSNKLIGCINKRIENL